MQYNGVELEEITESQVFDPPQNLLVWNDSASKPTAITVYSIDNRRIYKVIGESSTWRHCARIPESLTRATNRELARWLAEGKGQFLNSANWIYAEFDYSKSKDNCLVFEGFKVRKWNDEDWHEPTKEYLELENV